jgi:hypothetical protein
VVKFQEKTNRENRENRENKFGKFPKDSGRLVILYLDKFISFECICSSPTSNNSGDIIVNFII